MQTLGISPKLVTQFVIAALVWVLTHYGFNVDDPTVAAAISAVAGVVAGFFAPPGVVVGAKGDGP
jgi:hypothetical protein